MTVSSRMIVPILAGNDEELLIATLSPGVHLITLTATDSDDNQAVDSITIVIPFSCTLDLTLGFADGTLTIDFELGTEEPALWGTWIFIPDAGIFPLWLVPLPAIDPPLPISISAPGFPSIGIAGFFTALITSEGIICSYWETVDTGAPSSAVPTISDLRKLLPTPSRMQWSDH